MELIIRPGYTESWEQFQTKENQFGIALDGYIPDGPLCSLEGPWVNFNHHEQVSRLETRATCSQVLMAIRQGLFETFKDGHGQPFAKIFVNDCDQDVCLSVFLLKNRHLVEHAINPLVNVLVAMEDLLDTTAGSYAFPKDLPNLRKVLWVFEPYTLFRNIGGLDRKQPEEYASIIADVEQRIMTFITGTPGSIELDTRFEVIGGGPGWSMATEDGRDAKVGMYASGIKAFVTVRDKGNGRYMYTIGRISQFIPFDVCALLERLSICEGDSHADRWGGGNTIGGSPRVNGSRLKPKEVEAIINEFLCEGLYLFSMRKGFFLL